MIRRTAIFVTSESALGSADHADLDRVALAALGGRLVGTGKRAVAEERGHGDNRHDQKRIFRNI